MRKTLYLAGCLAIVATASSWYWTTKAVEQPPAQAIVELPTEEDARLQAIAAESDLIVTGRCLETRSQWVENNRILVTLAKIEVEETLKGTSASTVTIVLPGGSDSNRRIPVAMTYPGAPNIMEGEEVFLFLTDESLVPGGFSVSGFNEGKFSILTDETGNRLVSRINIRGTVNADPGSIGGHQRYAALAEFRNQVRRYIGQ